MFNSYLSNENCKNYLFPMSFWDIINNYVIKNSFLYSQLPPFTHITSFVFTPWFLIASIKSACITIWIWTKRTINVIMFFYGIILTVFLAFSITVNWGSYSSSWSTNRMLPRVSCSLGLLSFAVRKTSDVVLWNVMSLLLKSWLFLLLSITSSFLPLYHLDCNYFC